MKKTLITLVALAFAMSSVAFAAETTQNPSAGNAVVMKKAKKEKKKKSKKKHGKKAKKNAEAPAAEQHEAAPAAPAAAAPAEQPAH